MSIKNGDHAAILSYVGDQLRTPSPLLRIRDTALLPRQPGAHWLLIMTPPDPVDTPSRCHCGSGLRFARCCGLDWTAPWPEPEPAPEVGRGRAALAAGDHAEAERQLVELLERSPKHVGALAVLHDLRSAQGRTAAAEALLARIVRLEPNNLPATQALALLAVQQRRAGGGRSPCAQRRAHRPDRSRSRTISWA